MTNLTNNKAVLSWIDEMTAITKPDKIVWITGEEEQLDALREEAVKEGILIKLNEDGTKAAAELTCTPPASIATAWSSWRAAVTSTSGRSATQVLVVKRTVAGDNTMILHPDFAPDYNNGRDKVKDPSYDYFETIE